MGHNHSKNRHKNVNTQPKFDVSKYRKINEKKKHFNSEQHQRRKSTPRYFLSFFNSHASFKTSSPIRTSKKRTSNHATATTSTPQWHAPSRHTAPEPMLQRSDYYPEQVNLRKYIFKLNSTNQRTRDARPVPFRRNAQVTVFYSLSHVQIAPLFVCSREVEIFKIKNSPPV